MVSRKDQEKLDKLEEQYKKTEAELKENIITNKAVKEAVLASTKEGLTSDEAQQKAISRIDDMDA